MLVVFFSLFFYLWAGSMRWINQKWKMNLKLRVENWRRALKTFVSNVPYVRCNHFAGTYQRIAAIIRHLYIGNRQFGHNPINSCEKENWHHRTNSRHYTLTSNDDYDGNSTFHSYSIHLFARNSLRHCWCYGSIVNV